MRYTLLLTYKTMKFLYYFILLIDTQHSQWYMYLWNIEFNAILILSKYQFFVISLFSSTRIAQPASSWIDDYFDWLRPGLLSSSCCRTFTVGPNKDEFCPSADPGKSMSLTSHYRTISQNMYYSVNWWKFLVYNHLVLQFLRCESVIVCILSTPKPSQWTPLIWTVWRISAPLLGWRA